MMAGGLSRGKNFLEISPVSAGGLGSNAPKLARGGIFSVAFGGYRTRAERSGDAGYGIASFEPTHS